MIEFKTKLDENIINALTKKKEKLLKIVYLVITLLIIACGLTLIFLNELFAGIINIFVGIAYYIFMVWLSKAVQKKQNSSYAFLNTTNEQCIQFFDNELIISQTISDDYEGVIKMSYKYLVKVEETLEHYFLYISATQCYVLPKKDITRGSVEELDTILKMNLQGKYKSIAKDNKENK